MQVSPSPVNPILHVQSKLPSLSVHMAFTSHGLLRHSSMSVKHLICEILKIIHFRLIIIFRLQDRTLLLQLCTHQCLRSLDFNYKPGLLFLDFKRSIDLILYAWTFRRQPLLFHLSRRNRPNHLRRYQM